MLRLALSFRPHTLPRVRSFTCSTTRFGVRIQKNEGNSIEALESSPIVQAVAKRIEQRAKLQSQLSVEMNRDEDKEIMKKLSELEPIRLAWEEWVHTRKLLEDTLPLLKDRDPVMHELAEDEWQRLLAKLTDITETDFPAILVPPSSTARMSAILEIKPGVGGSEAMLFAADIMRMYTRLAQSMGWKPTVVVNNETERGGVKDAMLEIKGEGSYDALRFESGVHRVQRVPLTEVGGRVHTSTVAVLVLPLPEEEDSSQNDETLYKTEDVKIEVMRSRGAGGQHVNKTESAVRLTHIPTGITVSMQDERSQHQNRRRAFQVLQARLMDRKLTQEVLDRRSVRRNLVRSADRSEKIRTYNYAQDRVTDHRLGLSFMNLTEVMEGDGLRQFLDGMAKKNQEELLEEACESL